MASQIKFKDLKNAFKQAYKHGVSDTFTNGEVSFMISLSTCGNYILKYKIADDEWNQLLIEWRNDFTFLFFGKRFEVDK